MHINMTLEDLARQGRHSLHRPMALAVMDRIPDIRKVPIKECLSGFEHIEHRLELVTSIHGIEFINDSRATNVNSCWYALESINKKIVWIAGGLDKGNDYSGLKRLVAGKVKALICLGEETSALKNAFADVVQTIRQTRSIEEAVKMAYHFARRDEVVLFSPACASFDLFEDYEDRGKQFKKAVKLL